MVRLISLFLRKIDRTKLALIWWRTEPYQQPAFACFLFFFLVPEKSFFLPHSGSSIDCFKAWAGPLAAQLKLPLTSPRYVLKRLLPLRCRPLINISFKAMGILSNSTSGTTPQPPSEGGARRQLLRLLLVALSRA